MVDTLTPPNGQITSSLIFSGNKTTDGHDDPHCTGMISFPTAQIDELRKEIPKLGELWDAMSSRHKQQCRGDGVFSISSNYGFKEESQAGVSTVAVGYSVDVSRLSDASKAQITNWITDPKNGYNISGEDIKSKGLQNILDNPDLVKHLTTDMTVSGMNRERFHEAWNTYKSGADEFPYPLEKDNVQAIVGSVEKRFGKNPSTAQLDAYYDTALKMREGFPSSLVSEKNPHGKGWVDPDSKAAVPFYLGNVQYAAEYFIGAGPYAYTPPWTQIAEGKNHTGREFDAYDEQGRARDANGRIIAPERLEPLDGYNYVARGKSVSTVLSVEEAKAAMATITREQESPTPYDGYAHNCVSSAAASVMGQKKLEEIRNKVSHLLTGDQPDTSSHAVSQGVTQKLEWAILKDRISDITGAIPSLVAGNNPVDTEAEIRKGFTDQQGLCQSTLASRDTAITTLEGEKGRTAQSLEAFVAQQVQAAAKAAGGQIAKKQGAAIG